MDLWIRSQDRRILSKVSYLQEHFGNGKYGIYDEAIPMGYYESEERALEVLDEMQSYLINNTFAKKINGLGEIKDVVPNPLFVYEMPKE